MKLGERIRSSWRVLTGTKATSPRSVVLWPAWREGQARWEMTNLDAYIEEGFDLNAIIYSAIMYKVRSASAAPLTAYLGDRDHRQPAPPEHPLARLLDRPNSYQSFLELDGELRVYFNLFGNAYVWLKRDRGTGYPSEMRALRPDWMRHLYRNQELVGFVYVPAGVAVEEGAALLPEDVMHVRLPNPGDPYAGMGKGISPLAPLAQSADVDNAATAYLKQFFDYGAMPPGLLSFDVPMDDEDVASARNRWMEIYGGSHNWTDVAVMDQGGKYQRLGLTFAELDMKGLDGRNESRIAMPFGVPLTLIESRPEIVQSTYSNKDQDRTLFWEDTMVPELRIFEVEWLYFLTGDDGAFPAYDLSGVPALQSSQEARTTRLMEAAMKGLATRADYREAEGLPVTDSDRVYLMPIALREVPALDTGAPALPAPPTPDEDGRAAAVEDDDQRDKALTKTRELSLEEKLAVWKQIDAVATSYEPQATDAGRQAFEEDYREVRAIVGEQVKAARERKASTAWMNVLLPVLDYYRTAGKESWRQKFAPIFEALVIEQGQHLNATFGMTFDVRNLLGEDWYRSYEMAFSDPINQTSMDEIRDLFSTAFEQGATVPEMERSLDVLFRQWIGDSVTEEEIARSLFAEARLPRYRLENIARTETMRMSNAGASALYKGWGVHEHEWLATADDRTRPEHLEANGQVASIDGTFSVGGEELRFPGDPAGSPANVCQCRCTTIPVID